MIRTAYENSSKAIPKEILVDAARRYLLNNELNEALMTVTNIDSHRAGSSNLLLVSEGKTKLVAAMFHDERTCRDFVKSSIAYYFWLEKSFSSGKILSDRPRILEMFLFSHAYPTATLFLMDELFEEFRIHLVEYKILQIEGSIDPVIFFRHMTPRDGRSEKPLDNKRSKAEILLSREELMEFNRLKAHYLDQEAVSG
jgi:hypothetical protein